MKKVNTLSRFILALQIFPSSEIENIKIFSKIYSFSKENKFYCNSHVSN